MGWGWGDAKHLVAQLTGEETVNLIFSLDLAGDMN